MGHAPTPAEDLWHAWLARAHRLISDWESRRDGTMLTTVDAVKLAHAIADAMQSTYEEGRAARPIGNGGPGEP
jgi:hypothetical protein